MARVDTIISIPLDEWDDLAWWNQYFWDHAHDEEPCEFFANYDTRCLEIPIHPTQLAEEISVLNENFTDLCRRI